MDNLNAIIEHKLKQLQDISDKKAKLESEETQILDELTSARAMIEDATSSWLGGELRKNDAPKLENQTFVEVFGGKKDE